MGKRKKDIRGFNIAKDRARRKKETEALKATYARLAVEADNHLLQSNNRLKERQVIPNVSSGLSNIAKKYNMCNSHDETAAKVNRIFRNIEAYHDHWVNQPEDWKPKSHNIMRKVNSLISFLFCKYPVARFMFNVWHEPNVANQIDWFIHLANGGNIRTVQGLPITLTKKMAHVMMSAPDNYDVKAAVRRAQIICLGGNQRNVEAILRTNKGTDFIENEFWESVWRWFIANPMLDTNQYAPLVDYIQYQRFVPSVENPNYPDGPLRIPAQPNMNMHHRSVDATLLAMEQWHRVTARHERDRARQRNLGLVDYNGNPIAQVWDGFDVTDFKETQGEPPQQVVYRVVQLLTARELRINGQEMSHCVGSYVGSCARGDCAIFSMTKESQGRIEHLATIELSPNMIVRQYRGRFNATPSGEADNILDKWMWNNGLRKSSWMI